MALKEYNPTSAGKRHHIQVDRSGLWKGKPEKTLTEGLKKTGGRNNTGRLTSINIGGGHKKRYRLIDWKRDKWDVEGKVVRLEYDPNRTAFIALVEYKDGEKRYILAPQRLKEGAKIIAGEKVDVKPGNAMKLRSMPIGTIVHNIELKPGRGAQMIRSAGTFAQLIGRDQGYAQIRLASGELRMVRAECMATVGAVSNPDHMNQFIGKAGRNRWKGRKPHVRGVAMNPVDHPLGGGEGKTSGGRHPVSRSGVPSKGYKTRKNKTTDKYIIRRRNKRKDAQGKR
jgi:large subunit ribosomal protein L2